MQQNGKRGVRFDKKQYINYITKSHDTLHLICTKFHSTPYRMRQMNHMINLDEIQEGITLLVELNSLEKVVTIQVDEDQQSSPFKIYNAQPDMTYMRKPLFQQVSQVEQKFVGVKGDHNDTDEFQRTKSTSTIDYSNLDISIEIQYVTSSGNIPGTLQLVEAHITFKPNINKLKELLVENTIRKERDITDEIVERYHFKIMMEDIFLVKQAVQDKNETLEIYVFGVLGVDPPLKDGLNNYGVIKVLLIQEEKIERSIEEKIRFHILKNQRHNSNQRNLQLFVQLINDILSSDILQDNAGLFQAILKKSILQDKLVEMNRKDLIKQQRSLSIKCLTQVSFYSIVPIKSMESLVMNDQRLVNNLYKKKQLPVLQSTTEILDQSQFGQILRYIPEYLSQNAWYLMYSPTKHGTSYAELFRRCGMIGPHVLLIRDNFDTIFGAYLSDSWTRSGDQYYGSTDSFVFTFRNESITVYPSTRKNNSIQMANESGLHIGEDERPAISIDHELMRGSSFPCETFQNYVLAGDYNFKIIEMEIWGLSDDCEILQRALRQKISYFEENFQ